MKKVVKVRKQERSFVTEYPYCISFDVGTMLCAAVYFARYRLKVKNINEVLDARPEFINFDDRAVYEHRHRSMQILDDNVGDLHLSELTYLSNNIPHRFPDINFKLVPFDLVERKANMYRGKVKQFNKEFVYSTYVNDLEKYKHNSISEFYGRSYSEAPYRSIFKFKVKKDPTIHVSSDNNSKVGDEIKGLKANIYGSPRTLYSYNNNDGCINYCEFFSHPPDFTDDFLEEGIEPYSEDMYSNPETMLEEDGEAYYVFSTQLDSFCFADFLVSKEFEEFFTKYDFRALIPKDSTYNFNMYFKSEEDIERLLEVVYAKYSKESIEYKLYYYDPEGVEKFEELRNFFKDSGVKLHVNNGVHSKNMIKMNFLLGGAIEEDKTANLKKFLLSLRNADGYKNGSIELFLNGKKVINESKFFNTEFDRLASQTKRWYTDYVSVYVNDKKYYKILKLYNIAILLNSVSVNINHVIDVHDIFLK